MKLRTALLLGIVPLVALMIGAVTAGISIVLEREEVEREVAELAAGRARFEELQRMRASLYHSKNRVLAEEPRLRAVLATPEVSPPTVLGVARDLAAAVNCDLFVVTDASGRVVADTSDESAAGSDASSNPLIAAALSHGTASGVWADPEAAYQIDARAVAFGERLLGVSVVGYRLDDRVAESARTMSDGIFVITRGEQVLAASALPAWMSSPRRELTAALTRVPGALTSLGWLETSHGGERLLATSAPFPGSDAGAGLYYVVARSLDHALLPSRRLRAALWRGAVVLFAISGILAVTFAHGLSRPLDELVAFTRKVAAGDLAARTSPGGVVEVEALGLAMNRMAAELEENRRQAVTRVEKELEIAAKIQTSILPRESRLDNAEIATRMIPAHEVGGDYYDLLTTKGGGWIGIGDVTGHGVPAGMVMLLLQSSISALASDASVSTPSQLLVRLNALMFQSIRHRLCLDDHVTLSLIRYSSDGRLAYAGAHEDILVHRARSGRWEHIPPSGAWIGAMPDIAPHTRDGALVLETGDLLVLYTDGITEAMSANREQFGVSRLCGAVDAVVSEPVEKICDSVLQAVSSFMVEQQDDLSLVVLRYRGENSEIPS